MEGIARIILVANLISSLLNVIAYGIGYYKVNKAQVDGELQPIKRNVLRNFLVVTIAMILFVVVFNTTLFDSQHTTTALYVLNFALLFFNIGYNINALDLAYIVERFKKKHK